MDCGCCAAELFADKDPVCWACDAGETCATKKRQAAKAASAATVPSVAPRPKTSTKVQAAPIQEAPVGTKSTRVVRTRISDEIRDAIIAAEPTIQHSELARRYGISDVSVYTIRKAAGISVVKNGAKPRKVAETKAKTVAVRKVAALVRQAPEEVVPTAETISIHLRFTPEQLDSAWGGLSVASKAIAIAAALQAGIAV